MRFVLKEGEKLGRNPNHPVIEVVEGRIPYLWIGNNATLDAFCFAPLEGKNQLRALAETILSAIDGTTKKHKGATPCVQNITS